MGGGTFFLALALGRGVYTRRKTHNWQSDPFWPKNHGWLVPSENEGHGFDWVEGLLYRGPARGGSTDNPQWPNKTGLPGEGPENPPWGENPHHRPIWAKRGGGDFVGGNGRLVVGIGRGLPWGRGFGTGGGGGGGKTGGGKPFI